MRPSGHVAAVRRISRWQRAQSIDPSVTLGRPRTVLRRCGSIVIAEDPSTLGADGLIQFDDVFSAGASGFLAGVRSGDCDEIVWAAVEDVTERRQPKRREERWSARRRAMIHLMQYAVV